MNHITFAHPWVLILLILIPLMTAWYIFRYRKQKPALQFSNISLFKGARKTFRQRSYPLLFVLRMVAVTAIIIALALLSFIIDPSPLESALFFLSCLFGFKLFFYSCYRRFLNGFFVVSYRRRSFVCIKACKVNVVKRLLLVFVKRRNRSRYGIVQG